jgi:hypothetical protein
VEGPRADGIRLGRLPGAAASESGWSGGKTGCALQAYLTERSRPTQPEESYPYPAAADVRALIDHGLRVGWAPETRGGTYQIPSEPTWYCPVLCSPTYCGPPSSR